MEPLIRFARLGDADELARLRWAFHYEDIEDVGAPGRPTIGWLDDFRDLLTQALVSGRFHIWVVESDGSIVSNLWLEIVEKVPRPDDARGTWGYVTNVYTVPEHRGRGIGTSMMRSVIGWAKLRRLELLVVWPSVDSMEFYGRMGFASNPRLLELNLQDIPIRSSRKAVVVPHDPAWTQVFEHERAAILERLSGAVERVEHMGSTAVPGLGAKPIVDILIGVRSMGAFEDVLRGLVTLGYEYSCAAEGDMPFRRYFRKDIDGERRFQIHMVETSHDFFQTHLLFRDWLRQHPDDAADYQALKEGLSQEHDEVYAYTEAKSDFILGILARARSAI
ncbi:MAG TPA: bifunctional GNAT family N-acetyltransferase/GrpB family protein [Actinomycetota bacterium]|nr:bifunctional GNAT family N-acetyltransferase/GrpB family protein [Actinomycetota bacterium]